MGMTPSRPGRLASSAPGTDMPPHRTRTGRGTSRYPTIGVIRNPTSHRNKGRPPQPGTEVGDAAIVMPRSKPELETALADFAARQIDALVIDGGDGTVRDVLTRAAPLFGDNWPTITVLPKGKTNALAVDLGLPAQWPLAQALQATRRGRLVMRRPLMVERLDADQRRYLGFILGAGVFNTAIDAGQVAHRFGAFQGFAVGMTAVFGVVQAMLGIGSSRWRMNAPMRIRVGSDRQELRYTPRARSGERYFAFLTALSKFPIGFEPFAPFDENARINYLVMDAPLRRAIAVLPAVLYGRQFRFLEAIGIQRGTASAFELELEDPFIFDGERLPPGCYRVSLGPRLQFVVP